MGRVWPRHDVGGQSGVLAAVWADAARRDALPSRLSFLVYILTKLLVPITFFIAIQRYRLYEIDRIINKALVYGALSVILVAVYVMGVIGLQALARAITGQESPIALVASTLLIAGLFQPLRSRIQKLIDRRFYRSQVRRPEDARRLQRHAAPGSQPDRVAGAAGRCRQRDDAASACLPLDRAAPERSSQTRQTPPLPQTAESHHGEPAFVRLISRFHLLLSAENLWRLILTAL